MEKQDLNKEREEAQKPKTVFELLVLERRDISGYAHSAMVIKIKDLDRRLDMRYLDEDLERLVKIEYDATLEILEKEHNKTLLTIFSLTPVEMEMVSQQFKIYQMTGQIISTRDLKTDAIKVEWYEFFKKKKIVKQFASLINGEEQDFSDSDWKTLFKTLGKNVEEDLKFIYSDPLTAEIKFLRYAIHLYYENLYLQNLKHRLEPDCDDDDDNCPFKADAEAYRKLKTEPNVEESENKENGLRDKNKIRWRQKKGDKIDLIRVIIALYDSKIFEDENGSVPTQEQVIKAFGQFLDIDLANYETDLSNGFMSKIETNVSIFDKMQKAITKRHTNKNLS